MVRRELHRLGLEQQLAAAGHGVAGVEREVEHREFQLRRIRVDRGQVGSEPRAHAHVAAQDTGEQMTRLSVEPGTERDQLGMQRPPLGEDEQPACQLGPAARRVAHRLDQLRPVFRTAFGVVRPFQQREAAGHDLQQIVEVVRDAARELPQGLQLLRPAQPLLGLALLRHIPCHAQQPRDTPGRVAKRSDDHVEGQRLAAGQDRCRVAVGSAQLDAAAELRTCDLRDLRMMERLGWLASDLRTVHTQDALGLRIEAFVSEDAVLSHAHDEQRLGKALEIDTEAGLARGQLGCPRLDPAPQLLVQLAQEPHGLLARGNFLAHLQLAPPSAKGGASGSGQRLGRERPLQKHRIAEGVEQRRLRRRASCARRPENEEWQVRPARLPGDPGQQRPERRAGQVLLGCDDRARPVVQRRGQGGEVGAPDDRRGERGEHVGDDASIPAA